MVVRFQQEERYGPNLTIVKRTRFNQTIEPYRTNEVPARIGELPALPVRERQQDNMLQHPNNMIQDEEVVHFGQRVQQPQDQQQLQLQQHNISHNPVYPKHNSSSQNKGDLTSVVKQVENLNRHVSTLEGRLVTRIEVCESDINMASNQALELVAQYNEVSRNLSMAIQQVHKLRAEWDEWNGEETRPQDQENQEEIVHDPAEQSTMVVPTADPALDRSGLQDRVFRSWIDLSPIQHQREILTPPPTAIGSVDMNQRNHVEGFAKTVLAMAALKGTRRLYVQDQTGFHIGRIVIIHDLFAAQIVAYGSVTIDRPVDRDYPVGSTVRELSPQDDHRVYSQGRTIINGVAMDPGDYGSNTLPLETYVMNSGRQIPPILEDGMLVNLEHESKLHAWLLQGMTKTGRTHWQECADCYRQYKPTVNEAYAKEDGIRYDQYVKAINHIGTVPDMQGRLLIVIHQVRTFEQSLLRVMKGLSRAYEFYAKLLLNGVYEFLERLRTLLKRQRNKPLKHLLRSKQRNIFIRN